MKEANTEKENSGALYFKDALYYPFIEISNESWLKTACLYWDSISTIVPSKIKTYKSKTSIMLKDAEILQPFSIDPEMPELKDVSKDVVLFLDSAEGREMISLSAKSSHDRMNVEKFSHELRYASMHDNKFNRGLLRDLHRLGVTGRAKGGWINVPRPFANYYMTILASAISRNEGKALLTDTISAAKLGTKVMIGDAGVVEKTRRKIPSKIAEGILANMVLRTVELDPKTSVKKIIKFREKQSAEIGKFRATIRELVDSLNNDIDPVVLSSHISTLYSDKVIPAIDDLRGRLGDNRISCGYNNLKLSTLMSASPTALGAALAATSLGPFALAAGVGLSVVLSTANYQIQRKEILRNSPFSYIISAEKKFGKKK
ncbi:MAG: hypothetical protein U9R24_04630 [Thermodesulfobacteriota bacterium]|nr:hypothetical protein [Thermodesulfobacteriota bacterium]